MCHGQDFQWKKKWLKYDIIINCGTGKPVTISCLGDLLITCKGTIGELPFNHVGDVHIARQIMAIRKKRIYKSKVFEILLNEQT